MKKFYYILVILAITFSASVVFAKTDLSIAETDITFSKENILDGDIVRVYARVFNTGDADVLGHVIFLDNGKEMADPQPISIKVGTYDDVFIDWTSKQGTHDIKANLVGLNPKDDNPDNNSTTKASVFVDLDTNKNGIGDLKDPDIDGDGLTNEEEAKIGTNPLVADTDGDGVNDKIDALPKDATETRDTDGDSLGDNKDLDDDGDGIFDDDELYKYGTNPQSADSDLDGLADKQEIDAGTNPIKTDTDGDGVKDPEDKFPIDASKWQASLFGSLSDLFKSVKQYLYWGLGIFSLIILYFLFRRKKRR